MTLDLPGLAAAAWDAVPRGLISVYLFGSRPGGLAHGESDLDVGILLDSTVYTTSAARFARRTALLAMARP